VGLFAMQVRYEHGGNVSFVSVHKFWFPGVFLICNPDCWTEAVLSTGLSAVVMTLNS